MRDQWYVAALGSGGGGVHSRRMAQAENPRTPRTSPLAERDAFVFLPTSEPAPLSRLPVAPEERPRRAWTVTRIVVVLGVVPAVLAAVFYAVGLLVKLQLDKVFVP